MAGSVVLALDHHFVVVLVVAVYEEGEEECDKEGERRDNRQRPASLEHGARLVDIDGPWTVALAAVISEWSEIEVQAAGREARAVGIGDSA